MVVWLWLMSWGSGNVKKKSTFPAYFCPLCCCPSKPPEINRAVGCVCCPSKPPEINGAVGRCPSKISGTRRALDEQPSRAWVGVGVDKRSTQQLHIGYPSGLAVASDR